MAKFSYKKIDEVPEAFYEGVVGESGFVAIPNKKVKVTVNGKPVTVNIQLNRTLTPLWNRYSNYINGETNISFTGGTVYDPIDADEKFHVNPNQYVDDWGHLRTEMVVAPGTAELQPEQIKTRVLTFVKIMQMITDESIAEYIAQVAPKKKDGSLYLKRIVHIATCFCQRDDLQMQEIYAQVKKDDEIVVSSRLETHASVEDLNKDLIVKTDLFREI